MRVLDLAVERGRWRLLVIRVGNRIMTVGVSGNDLHPASDDEAKRLERAAAELIAERLKN
jgi:hypothetical protein